MKPLQLYLVLFIVGAIALAPQLTVLTHALQAGNPFARINAVLERN